MFRRGFSVAACGALALLLTAAETAPAQVAFFPLGRGTGAVFGPRGGYFFPGVYGGYPGYGYPGYGYSGYGGYSPYFNQSYYSSYSITTETVPIYYGAASLPGYSAGYSAGRIVSPAPGVGLRAAGVTEAAYSAPNYPIQAPDYTARYPVSVSASVTAAMTEKTTATEAAQVEVHVPSCAQIWFDGQKTSQGGTERTFTSPGLASGQNYVYEVRAAWTLDGKTVDQTRRVAVHAGDHVVVDFQR